MTFSNSKVGDKVYTISKGWGEVDEIDNSEMYSITVMFDEHTRNTYTKEGKEYEEDINPNLFWDEVVE